MNPCQATKHPEALPVVSDLSQVAVLELDEAQQSTLPIAVRIGLRLMANEALLQQTPFVITNSRVMHEVLAAEIGLDPTDDNDVATVKSGINDLREADYLGFRSVHLPVITENFKHEEDEVLELHVQPTLTPKFEHVVRGSVEAARQQFPDKQ
jgi:hypothetical protein